MTEVFTSGSAIAAIAGHAQRAHARITASGRDFDSLGLDRGLLRDHDLEHPVASRCLHLFRICRVGQAEPAVEAAVHPLHAPVAVLAAVAAENLASADTIGESESVEECVGQVRSIVDMSLGGAPVEVLEARELLSIVIPGHYTPSLFAAYTWCL